MSLSEFAAWIDLIMVLGAILTNNGKVNTSNNTEQSLYGNLILNNYHKLRFWISELESLGPRKSFA